MKGTVRRIGDSRAVLIPASILAACGIEDEVDLRLDGKRIIIESLRPPRAGWFDRYLSEGDEDAWESRVELDEPNEEWWW